MNDHFIWAINPVLFDFGILKVRWYGLCFATAFLIGFQIMVYVYKKENKPLKTLETLFVYMFFGTVIGARLGHCLFYQPGYFLSHPLEILMVWKGGLASHGSAIGMLISLFIYSKKYKEPYLWLLSRISLTIPIGGALIRIGNFFNSEIIGIKSSKPWAIVFSNVDFFPRHPAMLYESFCYFITSAILLYVYKKNAPETRPSLLLGLLFTLIFSSRFVIEYFKITQAKFENSMPLHMGQILSIPFIIIGLLLIFIPKIKHAK